MREQTEVWEREISKESARGQIMLGAALVDDLLRDLLEASIRPNTQTKDLFEGPTAPFSNFSNRIRVCFVLGLLDREEYDCLNLLRKIRNEFAHKFEVTFGDSTVQSRLKEMNRCLPKVNQDEVRDYIEQCRALVVALGIRITVRTHQAKRENPALLVDKSLEEAMLKLMEDN